MGGKWSDDIELQPRGSVQPNTVAALLRARRLTDATEDDQETAIRAWLDTHPPTPLMTHSLNRNGYGHLLNGGIPMTEDAGNALSRFSDDLHLVPPSEYVPTTAQSLLSLLGLDGAAPKQQEDGICEWLGSHPLTPMMEHSLRCEGFDVLGWR